MTRKQIGVEFMEELRAADPARLVPDKAKRGAQACLRGLKDADVMKESKAGAVFFRWVEGFNAAANAAAGAEKTQQTLAAAEAAAVAVVAGSEEAPPAPATGEEEEASAAEA